MSQKDFNKFVAKTKKVLVEGTKKYPQHFTTESVVDFERTMRKMKRTLRDNHLLNEWNVPFHFKTPEDLLLFENNLGVVNEEILNEQGGNTTPAETPAETPARGGGFLSKFINKFGRSVRRAEAGAAQAVTAAEREAAETALGAERAAEDVAVETAANAEDAVERATPVGRAQDQAVEFLRQDTSDEDAWKEMTKPNGDWQKTNSTIRSQIVGIDKLGEWYNAKTKDEKAGIDAYTEDKTKSRKGFGIEVADLKKEMLAMFGDYREVKKGLADVIDAVRPGTPTRVAGYIGIGNIRGAFNAAKSPIAGGFKAVTALPGALARHAFGGAQRVVGGVSGIGKGGNTNIRTESISEAFMMQDLFMNEDVYVPAPELVFEEFIAATSTFQSLTEVDVSAVNAAILGSLQRTRTGSSLLPDDAIARIARQFHITPDDVANATHSIGGNVPRAMGTPQGMETWRQATQNLAHATSNAAGGVSQSAPVVAPHGASGAGAHAASSGSAGAGNGWLSTMWKKMQEIWQTISPKLVTAKTVIWRALTGLLKQGWQWMIAHPYLAAGAIIAAVVAGASAVVLKRRAERIKTLQNIARFLQRRPNLYKKGRATGRDTKVSTRTDTSRAGTGSAAEPTPPLDEEVSESVIPSEAEISLSLLA